MQEARILYCEDSEIFRSTIESVLSVRGIHRVVAWAETVSEAEDRLREVKDNRLDANVLLLDANLRGGLWMNHPRVILAIMKELELDLPAVGLSADGLVEHGLELGREIAADLTKEELGKDVSLLDRVLDDLPEPPTK